MAVVLNLLLVYAVSIVTRIEFLLENLSYFKASVADTGHLLRLMQGGTVLDTPGIMYLNVLWILMVLLPLHWKENDCYRRLCRWTFVVSNFVGIAANLADSVYFRYTLRRSSSELFNEFSNESNLGSIIGIEVVHHWYLVLLAAVLTWVLWRFYFTPRIDMKRQPLWRYYLAQTLSLVVGAVTVVSGIRGGLLRHWHYYVIAGVLLYVAWRLWKWSHRAVAGVLAAVAAVLVVAAPWHGFMHRDIRPVTLSNANEYISHPTEAALVLNTPFSIIRTIGKAVFHDPGYYSDKAELESIYNPVHQPDSALTVRHKNVVILIVESFGREYIGGFNHELLGADYKGYTPFTDSLMQHAVTFKHSYSNGRKSIDGMPSVLSGIPMFVKPFILTPQSLNRVSGIAGYLGKKGYASAFFHGAQTGSMGFNSFAHSTGFAQYVGREDFEADERFGGHACYDGHWGIWDEPFLQFYAAKMGEMSEPFVTAVFTLSSHHPFHIPEGTEALYPEGDLEIAKCIRYTDHALQRFFESARKQPWYNNTIFVLTSDHTNMSAYDVYKSDIGGFCAPVIFYDPSGEMGTGMRDAVAQQTDILPTLLGWLGYDEPYVAFGCDLMHTPDAETWAVNYLNGTYQYVKYGWVLQFDGQRTTAIYSIDDQLMQHNMLGQVEQQATMERELKAIIQQYMDRMCNDKLVP